MRAIRKRLSMGVVAIAAAITPALTPTVRADEVLEYLDSHGLDALAAMRLEELAKAATGEEKGQLLDRLADLLARMLDSTSDPAAQARLLAHADELADRISSTRGDNLRVAAARTRYRSAARVAESIRAGRGGDSDGAVALLTQQFDTLLEISGRAEKRATDIDRRMDKSDALKVEALDAARDRENALAGVARYLAAWSLVYRGFLTADRRDSDRAASIFLPLLGARDGQLLPSEVSEPLRADELYASAILGLALAKAPTGGYAEASRWLDLLSYRETFAAVRESREGWSMVAALDARAFEAAREHLAKLALRDDAASWARVAASRAIETGGADKNAVQLLREAVAMLAARRDLAAVRDLSRKYGDGILGSDEDGFVPRYVKAVRLYDDAQTAIAAAGKGAGSDAGRDSGAPESTEARAASEAASAALGLALAAGDAREFPDAVASCRLMQAWSLRGAGRFAEAAAAFDEVAGQSIGDRAEEAARLAILSLDDARRKASSQDARREIDAKLVKCVDEFLTRFPGSDHVPEVLVRKISATPEPTVVDVDALLRIPRDSKDWLLSRRQALDGLYRAFRSGKDSRADTGKKFVAVLGELPVDPNTGLPSGSSSIARQALEVMLSPEVKSTQGASEMILALEKAGAAGSFDIRQADEEIAYRKLQLAMMTDRWADVETALAPFEKPEATKLWADAALRLAVRGAEAKRRSIPADAPERAGYIATIVRAGETILTRAGGYDAALSDGAQEAAIMRQIAAVLLDARTELVRSNADIDESKRGLDLVAVMMRKRPNDAGLLRAGASFAEATGDLERAAELLRTLVGGLPPRTDAWFEAKVDQIRVLARISPSRARAVIAQYRTLYPDLGPEPHRGRIISIEKSLPPESISGAERSERGAP